MLMIITFPAILLNFSVFLTFNIRNQIRRSALATYTLYKFRFKWMWGSDFNQLVLKVIVYRVYKYKHKFVKYTEYINININL